MAFVLILDLKLIKYDKIVIKGKREDIQMSAMKLVMILTLLFGINFFDGASASSEAHSSAS